MEQLAQYTSLSTRVGIHKLGHSAIGALTALTTAAEEVSLLRQEKEVRNKQASKRLKQKADKVIWVRQDIEEARERRYRVQVGRRRGGGKMRLI